MTDSIRVLMFQANRNSRDKGWWDEERTFGDQIALMHSELSEALEEFRNGHRVTEIYYNDLKPEGVAVELADVLIRVFDTCEQYGVPLVEALNEKMAYNATRPHRHGGKVI